MPTGRLDWPPASAGPLPAPSPSPAGAAPGVAAHRTPVLACEDLAYAYGSRTAVGRLSFVVRPGEAYGLLGPNGAGKTTTIRMVCGIVEPQAGSVRVAGSPVSGPRGRRARAALGYVPQEIALFPSLTLVENLAFWATAQGVGRAQRRGRIAEALEVVGLADRAGDQVCQCSGGMQRRLNLAAALLHGPALLVLDEPTVGVDAQSRAALLDALAALRDGGTAVLYTSHYMDEVERLCDRVGIVDHGRLVAEGPPAALLAEYGGADLEAVFLDLTGRALRD